MRIATANQMRGMDGTAIEEIGIPSTDLMERAAAGFARAALELCGKRSRQERAEGRGAWASDKGLPGGQ